MHSLLFLFLEWFFYDVPKGILKAFWNFLRFYFNYFSIPLLLKTLFSPWRRYRWSYGRGFDLKRYLSTALSNAISRLLGAFIRILTIFIGLVFEVLILAAGVIVFCGWFLLPILLVSSLYFGLRLLIG
ncbi:hypothetical protein J7J81_03500 [bacterium]|nr:hypothetical protein [bacterium]